MVKEEKVILSNVGCIPLRCQRGAEKVKGELHNRLWGQKHICRADLNLPVEGSEIWEASLTDTTALGAGCRRFKSSRPDQ